MKIDARTMEWIRKPNVCNITEDKVTITTEPFTDLWQRTYYHFRNDNAPILQMKSEEQFFSFVVRTDFAMTRVGLSCILTVIIGSRLPWNMKMRKFRDLAV